MDTSSNTLTQALADSVGWCFRNSYAQLPERFYTKLAPTSVSAPSVVVINDTLAKTLGLDLTQLNINEAAALFAGNTLPAGSEPLAQSYAGHQFGHFNRLGDGRAHLLGEHIAPDGQRYDIQFKGSGPTPYSRRGDGRAALGPMLREYIVSEAMHALGIPTTRSLAVVATGEPVMRETVLQGAILTRVASSHVRVGTFEYVAANGDPEGLKLLADYTIDRHFPQLRNAPHPYSALLDTVIDRQASLIAAWMQVGFIHGVMNTDNMTLSGETIDYGPCAFMDRYDPATVFSSIDRHGRYAFGNQATIAQWNLARFAETLLPLLHEDMTQAIRIAEEAINRFSDVFTAYWSSVMRKKLGIWGEEESDITLINGLLKWMQKTGADYTNTFRDLMVGTMPADALYHDPIFQAWHTQWSERRTRTSHTYPSSYELMQTNNPVVIPRNHHVEAALAAAEQGNLTVMEHLLAVLRRPYEDSDYASNYQQPAPPGPHAYKTFCGT